MNSNAAWKVKTVTVAEGLPVLVVEDNPDVAEMLEHFFKSEGCHVERAGTGAAALAAYWSAVGEGRPHELIMLDFMLPGEDGMDGLAVARRIRAAEREAGKREAYICGYTAHADAIRAPGAVRRAGLDKFLIKSSNADEMAALRGVVLEALEKRARPLGRMPGGEQGKR